MSEALNLSVDAEDVWEISCRLQARLGQTVLTRRTRPYIDDWPGLVPTPTLTNPHIAAEGEQ